MANLPDWRSRPKALRSLFLNRIAPKFGRAIFATTPDQDNSQISRQVQIKTKSKAMFAITPRVADDHSLFNLFDDTASPYNRYQRGLLPVQFGDGAMGHIGGRIGGSQVENADKEFHIRLDLSDYKPEEVKITTDNHKITVNAKHEERQDNHGFVSRQMTRSYTLPKDVDVNSATSTMNSNGTLSIKLSKKALEAPKETNISVQIENKK